MYRPRTIGTSGKLYQDNLVTYDRATHTYWSQIGSFALQGPLLGSSLVRGQSVLTKWATWKKLYPQTRVLGRPIASGKNYNSNPYAAYSKTDRLLYDSCYESYRTESPYVLKDTKESTLVVFTTGGNVHLFASSELVGRVNNVIDLDDNNFMVVYDSKNTLSYAYSNLYNATKLQFIDAGSTAIGGSVNLPTFKDKGTGSVWNVSGICISGPLRGAKLSRLTSFSTYWAGATSFYPKAQIWIDNSTLQYFPTSCPKVTSDTQCSVPCSSIVAAGPAQDAIESIDAPYFISADAFENIVRVPRKTITLYTLLVTTFVVLAASLYGYHFYQRCLTKPPEVIPLPISPPAGATSSPGANGVSKLTASSQAVFANAQMLTAVQRGPLAMSAQPAPKKKSSLEDSAIVPLILKDDDEEEPALPPENPEMVAKLVESPLPTARRKRRNNKKHGRSVSLIGDEANAALAAAQENYLVPMSARGPTPTKRASFGSYHPVPRLSIASSPWPTQDSISHVPHASTSYNAATSSSYAPRTTSSTMSTHGSSSSTSATSHTAPTSAASTSELKETRSGSHGKGMVVSTSNSSLRRNPHSESALSDITSSSANNEPQDYDSHSMSSARSNQSQRSSKSDKIVSSSSAAAAGPSLATVPLVHRSGRELSSEAMIPPSPRSRTMFEEALEQSNSYSTSIDSLSPDNYQISLTSVNSGDEDIPDHIMSAAALARIKGQMKKSSSSVRANDVFAPVLDTVSESSDDSIPGVNPATSSRSHSSVFSVFQQDPTELLPHRHQRRPLLQDGSFSDPERSFSDPERSFSDPERSFSYSSADDGPSDGPSINLSSSGPSDGPSLSDSGPTLDLDY